MEEEKYYVILTGTILDGHQQTAVVAALEQLLRLPRVKAYSMLQGKRSRIHKELTKERADRLQIRLIKAGAGCFMEPVTRDPSPEEQQPSSVVDTENTGLSSIDEPVLESPTPNDDEEMLSISGKQPVVDDESQHEGLSLDLAPDEESLLSEPSEMRVFSMELEPLTKDALAAAAEEELARAASERVGEDQGAKDEATGVPADSTGTAAMSGDPGRFFEQPSLHRQPVTEAENGGALSRNRTFAIGGALLLLAVLVWVVGGFLIGGDEPQEQVRQEEPKPPADPLLAQTEERMIALGRSVKVWMIQYGFGFDPHQVTLSRVQSDLGLSQDGMVDVWGTPLRYQPESGRYSIVSAGADRAFGTGDDLTESVNLQ